MRLLTSIAKKRLIAFITLPLLALGIIFLTAVFLNLPDDEDGRPDDIYILRTNHAPPASYVVKAGETIFDIARMLGVPLYDIVIANRITGETPLAAGTILKIPRFTGGKTVPRPTFAVKTETPHGTAPHTVLFSSDFNFDSSLRFVWDLGNNRYSFKARPKTVYIRPGCYPVRLVTVDGAGRYEISRTLVITVDDIAADEGGAPFITVDRAGDIIDISGRLRRTDGTIVDFDEQASLTQSAPLVEYFGKNKLLARGIGFSRVKVEKDGGVFEFNLFVSPLPARLSAEPEYDWYKTQFNTGMYGNCGPAAAAAVIRWATGVDVTVEKIREEIGMPHENGAVGYDDLCKNLGHHSVPSSFLSCADPSDIFTVIDRGGVVIVSFNCGAVTRTVRDKTTDFFDRYYPDATGHYLLIKGYSLDRRYFIVYDAIPGEWEKNELRYRDGVSMIGRNRFFRVREVMAGLGTRMMIAAFRDKTRPRKSPPGRH